MKIVNPGYEILSNISPFGMYELMDIEEAARVCYRSEDKMKDQAETAKPLIKRLIENGHEAMLEHSSLMVRFICDRAIANEIVRHRMASFAQESTRYCNYSLDKFGGDIYVILPHYIRPGSPEYGYWTSAVRAAEGSYMALLQAGQTPQEARCVLPLCLATRIVVTANYREWRHILKLRTAKDAHPQIRELMIPLLKDLQERIPVVFDDIKA